MRKKAVILVLILFLFSTLVPTVLSETKRRKLPPIGFPIAPSAAPNWLIGWDYRKSHNIVGETGAGTDYQIKIDVHYGSGSDSGEDVYLDSKSRRDFGDVRFTDNDGSTLLDYWMEGGKWWTKYASNPILSPTGSEDHTTFASALKNASVYHMYYQYHLPDNTEVIGHATSNDGKSWTKDTANNPVLNVSASGWDSLHVGVPMVWKEGSTWNMIYRGSSGTYKIGLATSIDGTNWTKSGSNPVLEGDSGEWDDTSLDPWGVIKVGSTYYLWYNRIPSERKTGVATSTDLTSWTKDINNPIFSGGRFCAFAVKRGGNYYLFITHYTSGSDYSEIEIYKDAQPTFHSGNRTFVGVAFGTSHTGWDSHDQDTPCVLTDDIERDTFSASSNELWTYYAGENAGVWKTGMTIMSDIDEALNMMTGAFWVEVKDDLGSNQTIYIYYGKSDATTTSSGTNTFLFFDDFNRASLGGDWTNTGGTWSIASNQMKAVATAYNFAWYNGATYSDVAEEFTLRKRTEAYSGSGFRITNVSNLYMMEHSSNSDKLTWYKRVGGGWSAIGNQAGVTLNHGIDYFYTLKVADEGSGVRTKVDIDNVEKFNKTEATKTYSTGYFGVMCGGTNFYDNFRIRKYVDPEPQHGSWGAEEGRPTTIYSITSGWWQNATTWMYSIVPTSGDTAIICDGDTVHLNDNRTVKIIRVNATATLNIQGNTVIGYAIGWTVTLTFDDTAGTGWDTNSGGTIRSIGTNTYHTSIVSAASPPTNYWNADVSTGDPTLDLDWTDMSYGTRWRSGGVWDIENSTITNFQSAVDIQVGSTITNFNNNTLTGGTIGLESDVAHDAFYNVVITGMTQDIRPQANKLEFQYSNFDPSTIDPFYAGTIISDHHNDSSSHYLLFADTQFGGGPSVLSTFTNQPSSISNIEIYEGDAWYIRELVIDQDIDSGSVHINWRTHVTLNTYNWNFSDNSNLTINGTLDSSGLLDYTGATWFIGYVGYDAKFVGYVWLNGSYMDHMNPVISFPYNIGASNWARVDELNISQPAGADNSINITQRDFSVKGSGTVLTFNGNNSASVNTGYTITNLTSGLAYNVDVNGTTIYTIDAASSQISFSYTSEGIRTIEISYTANVTGRPPGDDGGPIPVTFAGFIYEVHGDRTVSFTSASFSELEILSYYWDFGDGTISTEENPVHRFEFTQPNVEYSVTLTVTDSLRDTNTFSSDVRASNWNYYIGLALIFTAMILLMSKATITKGFSKIRSRIPSRKDILQ